MAAEEKTDNFLTFTEPAAAAPKKRKNPAAGWKKIETDGGERVKNPSVS